MLAVIRHAKSGEHFLAELDEAFDAVALSPALAVMEATDGETGEVDWSQFEDAELTPWEDPADRWTSDEMVIEHRFEA